jgi:hypothetical protein
MRQPAKGQNEQDARYQVQECSEVLCHASSASLFFLLVHGEHALRDEEAAEDVHAGKHQGDEEPNPDASPEADTATASSAPTTITEEIALVTAISGVCSAGVTDHTT